MTLVFRVRHERGLGECEHSTCKFTALGRTTLSRDPSEGVYTDLCAWHYRLAAAEFAKNGFEVVMNGMARIWIQRLN